MKTKVDEYLALPVGPTTRPNEVYTGREVLIERRSDGSFTISATDFYEKFRPRMGESRYRRVVLRLEREMKWETA